MFDFFQSIFSGSDFTASTKYDADIIEKAIERVVDGTDPRLRALSSYRKKLAPAVETAIDFAVDLVDSLPPPVELSGAQFSEDDQVRGLFASRQHLREVLGRSRVLREYLDRRKGAHSENIYALLGAERSERSMLGMDLQGDMVRRDVMQQVVSFSNRLFACPGDSQAEASLEAKRRAFDTLIEYALQQMLSSRHKREDTSRRYNILKSKLQAMEAAGLGISALAAPDQSDKVDIGELQKQIAQLETELDSADVAAPTLDHYMDVIIESLSSPEQCLQMAPVSLKLDRMGMKLAEDAAGTAINLQLNELTLANGRRVIVLPVWIPVAEMPEKRDFLQEAGRYLG